MRGVWNPLQRSASCHGSQHHPAPNLSQTIASSIHRFKKKGDEKCE